MIRYVVDTNGVYYDSYHEITDFVIMNLNLLSTDIENYEHEALLAIL